MCTLRGHNIRTCSLNTDYKPQNKKKKKKKNKNYQFSITNYYLKKKEPILIQEYNMDGRRTAKKDEDIRVKEICNHINNNTELGLHLKAEYYEKFHKEILKVKKKGGNNIHYDILIYHTDGTTNQCEEKGTQHYSETINPNTSPWKSL